MPGIRLPSSHEARISIGWTGPVWESRSACSTDRIQLTAAVDGWPVLVS